MSSGNSSSFSVPQIKRKSRYQGTRFALRIKSSIYVACLKNTRKNYIVWPRNIADDPASLAFEAIETIIWKLSIAPVVWIVSKYFETTGAIRTIRTIIWKPGLTSLLTMKNFLCCLTFSSGKTPAFRTKIIQLSTWMRWPSPSICQCLDLEKETFWCDSYFPNKVLFRQERFNNTIKICW